MSSLKIFNRKFRIPQQKWLRIALGISLVLGGMLGFLPILGFWMVPMGFVVLSVDIPLIRRFRRRIEIKYARWRQEKTD